jgi:hypothetical protein
VTGAQEVQTTQSPGRTATCTHNSRPHLGRHLPRDRRYRARDNEAQSCESEMNHGNGAALSLHTSGGGCVSCMSMALSDIFSPCTKYYYRGPRGSVMITQCTRAHHVIKHGSGLLWVFILAALLTCIVYSIRIFLDGPCMVALLI